MSRIIAVAGGSGHLGRAIADAIRNDGKYEVVVLGRKVSLGECWSSSKRVARRLTLNYSRLWLGD